MTFEGYKGKESERKKKLVYNVLRQGDCYINTGDALTRDKNYFVYFADRLGDTFRYSCIVLYGVTYKDQLQVLLKKCKISLDKRPLVHNAHLSKIISTDDSSLKSVVQNK